MKFKIVIDSGNESLSDWETAVVEVHRIVQEAMKKWNDTPSKFKLFDVQGNSCGYLEAKDKR